MKLPVADYPQAGRCWSACGRNRLAEEEKIIAAPILSKKLTLPLRRFFGDMPQTGGILPGLDLRKLGDKTTNE